MNLVEAIVREAKQARDARLVLKQFRMDRSAIEGSLVTVPIHPDRLRNMPGGAKMLLIDKEENRLVVAPQAERWREVLIHPDDLLALRQASDLPWGFVRTDLQTGQVYIIDVPVRTR